MDNTFKLSEDDLVVCANLLFADAKTIEGVVPDGESVPSALKSIADSRRDLAIRIKAEVERLRSQRNAVFPAEAP